MQFLTPEEKASKPPEDCGLGHACEFCPQEAVCRLDKPHHNKVLIENRLAEIDQIIVVLANKGGVGKSTVSANLAAGLAKDGFRVGVADADIHGPNQSRFFGFAGAKIRNSKAGLQTHGFVGDGCAYPVQVGSLAFMQEDDTNPIVWRDAYKHDFIHHLIGSFDWGSLDFLVIDMPPGTGNELITLCDMLEGSDVSALLVTSPQAVAQMDSLKAGRFCNERGLPVIGAAVNMAGVQCPHCKEEFHLFPDAGVTEALSSLGIEKIADIPLAAELALGSDMGEPIVVAQPDTVVARAFAPIIARVAARGRRRFEQAVATSMTGLFAENLSDADMQAALADLPDGRTLEAEISALLGQEAARLGQASMTTKDSD
ncbi:P-loop NTPase [Roseobacter sinensis]|uniref:Iron-sulfur cluster carrier protein n=1 Tax=Roseobacter sinensis TaxID=2931391 RepID=A0ABT3BHH6_9RHOB|nr:P-loop NTPase [Roseobacter sp. WL0113]MCV3273025.1 P-loop NTPase [Roseobacter sp. WL0113]